MDDALHWYMGIASQVRLYCYGVILVLFLFSCAYEWAKGSRTMAAVFFSASLIMIASVLALLTGDRRVTFALTTPAALALAISLLANVYSKYRLGRFIAWVRRWI